MRSNPRPTIRTWPSPILLAPVSGYFLCWILSVAMILLYVLQPTLQATVTVFTGDSSNSNTDPWTQQPTVRTLSSPIIAVRERDWRTSLHSTVDLQAKVTVQVIVRTYPSGVLVTRSDTRATNELSILSSALAESIRLKSWQ